MCGNNYLKWTGQGDGGHTAESSLESKYMTRISPRMLSAGEIQSRIWIMLLLLLSGVPGREKENNALTENKEKNTFINS